MSMFAPQLPAGPLADLTVVELGEGTAAAFTAKLLADFGATAIKVERPSGDPTRQRGPFPDGKEDPNASGLFAYLNTNKLGVMVDLATNEGRDALAGLLSDADIFVTDLAEAELEASGVSARHLREQYPELIVAVVSPFGDGGPWSERIGDELTAFAASGLAYGTPGIPDAAEHPYDEPPLHPSCFVTETLAGVTAATAVMVAVRGRSIGSGGCHIDLSEQAASACIQVRDLMPSAYGNAVYNRLLNPVSIGRMPNFYLPCKDGYVTVAAPMDIHWTRLVEALGSPDWAVSEKYATEAARVANWEELRGNLSKWTQSLDSEELFALGERTKMMIFPFYPISRMADSDQVRSRESLVETTIGEAPARMAGAPFALSRTPWSLRRPAPRLGEHNSLLADKRTRVTT
ncbi:CoA transferase [Mesorhizobium sp. CAU 1741]|uniref:CaiB/BaiF CoA transferase family protein n=1 Tax=Mesorhizobium sp. CAU 1741 TaxID=3140366 RepID=UPI00325C2751